MARLEPGSVEDGEAFGWSVAGDDDRAIIGAYYGAGDRPGSGGAYIFRRQGIHWQPEVFLPGESFGDYLGSAVAIDGNRVLVGATGVVHNSSSGSVYVYERRDDEWVQQTRIDPAPEETLAHFGHAVALHGDLAVIAAFADDHDLLSGSVYVYRCSAGQWGREAQLVPIDAPEAMLGWSLAFDGTRILTGARFSEGFETSAAFMFERSADGGWHQTAHFTPPLTNGVGFGHTVGLDGDVAAIGAYKDHVHAHSSGAVYIYRQDQDGNWTLATQLGASDGYSYDYFGYSLAMQAGRLLVGAFRKDGPNASDCGRAYLFECDERGEWIETRPLSHAQPVDDEALGFSVAFAGGQALVGAVGAFCGQLSCGAVYCFAADDADCNTNGVPDLCDITAGTSADANHDAIPDECQPPMCVPDCAPPPDGLVNVDDLLVVISNWGAGGGWGPADIAPPGGDGTVNLDDLHAVIVAWGACRR